MPPSKEGAAPSYCGVCASWCSTFGVLSFVGKAPFRRVSSIAWANGRSLFVACAGARRQLDVESAPDSIPKDRRWVSGRWGGGCLGAGRTGFDDRAVPSRFARGRGESANRRRGDREDGEGVCPDENSIVELRLRQRVGEKQSEGQEPNHLPRAMERPSLPIGRGGWKDGDARDIVRSPPRSKGGAQASLVGGLEKGRVPPDRPGEHEAVSLCLAIESEHVLTAD